jgi:hypothetical protein
MNIRIESANCAPCKAVSLRGGLIPYLKLALGMALIALFMFGIAPLAKLVPAVRAFTDIAAERDIRVAAIYYTDLKESAEGSSYIRDSLDYPPRRE